ncbi:MAG: Fic family protein [archaeon]|nr:Fic family protein [archaeon]
MKMPTKYDVFATLIEKAPCRIKSLEFKTPIYYHISEMEKEGWVQNKRNLLTPVKNEITLPIFRIIKYCLNHGLDYNILFTKSMGRILKILPKSIPDLRPKMLSNNKEINRVLVYLEKNQFILKYARKPARGRLLQHQILGYLSSLYHLTIDIKKPKQIGLTQKILQIKTKPLNPFEEKVFAFLAGSVQLEGSTITEGDTRELLVKDIYPDKPAKDIQMVKNLNEALKYVLNNVESEINQEAIKEINRLIMFSLHTHAGKYKLTQNKIQGNPSFKTARPSEVLQLMQEFCRIVETIDSREGCLTLLGKLHNDLQRIHPFADGNSRTTRLILNWVLLKHDLPIVVLKMGSFDEYMSLTKLSGKRDDTLLNQLLLELIVHEELDKK